MENFTRLVALFALCMSFSFGFAKNANAQIQSATEEAREGEEIRGDTKVAEIREVERGVYSMVGFGANYYLPFLNDTLPLNEDGLSLGTRMDLRFGYDISDQLSVEGFVLANFNTGQLKPEAIGAGELTGDIAHLAPGVGVKFAFFSTKRLFINARGAVGYAIWFPSELAGDAFGSIHLEGALGLEYHTRLRHIAVGVELGAQALLFPTAIGVFAMPTIKYTF